MDFSFTDEQLALKKEIIQFAQHELNADLIRRDKEGAFSKENWKKCASFGVQGLPFPKAYGGHEADIITTMLAMEGLGYGCRDSGLVFGINAQMWSVQMPIWEFGTDEQKQKYLPRLISGDLIGGHGMSEPGAGSDAFSLTTTAVRQGDCYVLNGSKTFVSNGPVAEVFVVFATVDRAKGFMGVTAFLVEKGTPGFRIGPSMSKMGLRTSPIGELFFDDCKIPAAWRLGREGFGANIFNASMEWERSAILANYVGAMEYQLERCIRYAKERKQFGKPIGKFQSVANRLVDMKLRLETSRLLLYQVAWKKKTLGKCPMDAALAKLYLSESWVASCMDAIRIHGGYGFMTEYELERDLRDSFGGVLYSGTSEIQRNIIARHLGL
ncbi:MAG: acyl-CoA dehydrogenase family protein [candidate division KSB1 bacterium]|nr:acyl-CoA dehydrogenase family protein [candidate division KSB1 bacterium]MDZ7369234.1 acyl-CoA dehydrogenase family protein [candidate division KSB1 bacterium]MDZ7407232.1 acyl-CoA dehydrogenase family protein [candidate division KSB1 bacterium]